MSDDSSAKIIPIGKHKGKTVAELLETDPNYVQWLLAQNWFADRFAELHAALLNGGKQSEDTPEHNLLQARFLDKKFRVAFMLTMYPTTVENAFADVRSNIDNRLTYCRRKIKEITEHREKVESSRRWLEDHKERIEEERKRYADWSKSGSNEKAPICELRNQSYDHDDIVRYQSIDKLSNEIRELEQEVFELEKLEIPNLDVTSNAQFEQDGIDVVLNIQLEIKCEHGYHRRFLFAIELKPSLGDDYPSVIRQLRRYKSIQNRGYPFPRYKDFDFVVIAEHYTGSAVPFDSVRQMFEMNGDRLIMLHEIEANLSK